MPRNPHAREEFFGNYVNVLFMLLSLVQGLAFQELAQKARYIVPYAWAHHNLLPVLYCVFMLAIQLRILQTYITVGIDYGPSYVNFTDIVVLFVAGILQAFVLGYMLDPTAATFMAGSDRVIEVRAFWWATLALSLIAMAIYYHNVHKVNRERDRFATQLDVADEKSLQRTNGHFMLVLSIVALLSAMWLPEIEVVNAWSCLAPIAGVAIMMLTTAISLASTFGIRAYRRTDLGPSTTHATSLTDLELRATVEARDATDSDTEEIARMLTKMRTKELAELFGVSESRVLDTTRTLLRSESRHYLSCVNWLVAFDVSEPHVVRGAVLFESARSTNDALGTTAGKARFALNVFGARKVLSANVTSPEWNANPDLVTLLGAEGIRHTSVKAAQEYDFGLIKNENEYVARFMCSDDALYRWAVCDVTVDRICSREGSRLSGLIFNDDVELGQVLNEHKSRYECSRQITQPQGLTLDSYRPT